MYSIDDVGAPMSSGSYLTRGMLMAPASMRTVGEIATGVTSSLLTRGRRRRAQGTPATGCHGARDPLNLIHLRNMATITEAGGTIFPPVPAFYSRPQTIEAIVDHTVGRALDQSGIHTDVFPRWDDTPDGTISWSANWRPGQERAPVPNGL